MAHLYETGRLRRVHLRGHNNILKRLLIQACGLNLGLLLRTLYGVGTPRGLQDGRWQCLFLSLLMLSCYLMTDSEQTGLLGLSFERGETPIYPSAMAHAHFCPVLN
jgi:hypothetical protein